MQIRQPAPNSIQDNVALPPNIPALPEDVFQRFPSLRDWQEEKNRWWTRAFVAIQNFAGSVGDEVDAGASATGDLFVQFNAFTAAITTDVAAIANEQEAQARRIVTVSAIAGLAQSIKVQGTAPITPALNDYWVDNSVPALPITYQWDGASWVEVTTQISAAAVATEAVARVTADGFLSGKYTLTVAAGNVVTGMNITSQSGPGTNISDVTFVADNFKIITATGGSKQLFSVTTATVKLGNVLVVDLANSRIYIGTGVWGNAATPFFVDSGANFSLGDKLTWNGSVLNVSGTVVATAGSIGGWDINASTISKNNAILDSAGQLVLGTSNDVVYISATDGTYRLWIGNVSSGSAAFKVTKAGVLTCTGATIVTGSGGDLVSISPSGLQVGVASVGAVYLNNNAGNAYLNLRYNGNVYGSWGVQSDHTAMQLSDNAGNSVTIDGRGGPGVSIFGPAGPGLLVTNDATILGNLEFGTHSAIGALTVTGYLTCHDATGTPRKLAVVS